MWGKRRLNLLANESKIRENTEKEAQRKPEEEPKVGEVKEYIFDEMTEEQIGSVLWTAEAIAKWHRRQTAKALQRRAKYGCVGHPGKPTGRYQVTVQFSIFFFFFFFFSTYDVPRAGLVCFDWELVA